MSFRRMTAGAFAALALSASILSPLCAEDAKAVLKLFADPPREYSTGPLWTWNDLLTEEQVVATLRDLAGQKVRQVWVHPQPGLMTPYLSADWFRLWKAALDEAKKLDMNIWMYDENSYPSGFAGGYVPEAMPASRGRGLHFREEKRPGKVGPDVLAVFRLDGAPEKGAANVTQEARSGKPLPDGKYLTAVVVRAANSPWHGGRCYVDLLYPGVTQKFLEITLDPYWRRFGDEFGKHIPGVFMDEPSILPAGGLPWTDDLPEQFQKRWGYALLDHLASLARPVGDWQRVRHNYFQVLLDLYIERWAKPYFDYCQRHGIELTGHYLEHEWPSLVTTPDFMAMQAWEHRPGIDLLFNQYREMPREQFGNVRIVKEIGSVANQLGRQRTLSETYAGSGHEIRFEEMKRQGDWEYVLGLNTLNECLSHVTIRGVRKGNWPRTLSYHNPWWEAYHVLEGYFTRLSVALSHGKQVNPILVLEPTTTAWMYQGDGPQIEKIGTQFQSLLMGLERAQVEYDLGSEDIVARQGSVDGPCLVVGQRRYRTIVLAPLTENLNAKTMDLLATCLKAGAAVISCGLPPMRIDGQVSPRGPDVSKLPGWKQLDAAALAGELSARSGDGFAIQRDNGDRGLLFHHRRQLDDGHLLFLVNTSIDNPGRGAIRSPARSIQAWCPATGRTRPYRFAASGQGVEARFDLPPCGSLLLFLSNQSGPSAPVAPSQAVRIEPVSAPAIRRLDDNVLVMNYLYLSTRGETKKSIHCRQATNYLFTKNGFTGNPWFEAVQFADEHIRRKFPPESGFEATYRFVIAERVPDRLQLVLERPDLYQSITCNGVPVGQAASLPSSTAGSIDSGPVQRPGPRAAANWWLDRAFKRIDVRAAARVGENVVTIKAAPFGVLHELEPAYVLGTFSLQPGKSGFTVVPETPLCLEPGRGWNVQGHPFYSGGVAYAEQFDVPRLAGRYCVNLPDWLGSVAKVIVNGKPAGYIAWRPWECDVTELIQPGRNTIEVVVIGTLRNTLGPHHAGPPQGIVTPHMFNQAPASGPPPGEQYTTIGYGLFRPFVLNNLK